MTVGVKSFSAKAMIVAPPDEPQSALDPIEFWKNKKGGLEKTKKMVELYMNGSLENDAFFSSIRDMCIDGKILHPISTTKFQEHLLKDSIIDIASTWAEDCVEVITFICNNKRLIYKILKERIDKGNFSFKAESNSTRYQFANVLDLFGLATLDKTKKKIRCDLTNKGSCNGIQILKIVLSKSETSASVSAPPKLIEDGVISDEMVTVDASTHISLVNISKQNSDNKSTTGKYSPIGNRNQVKKSIVKNINKDKKDNWFKDKVLPTLFTTIILLIVAVAWALIRGYSWQDIAKTFDTKAGIHEKITPTVLITPTPVNQGL